MSKPALSLILCSRNDQYMGNSRWRLQTALNYLAHNVHALDRMGDVKVVVTDWGSEVPLHTALELSPVAARMVSFVVVPPALAHELQKDSPFSEVHALNAAARRASGQYIGRIDQDILVGKRFLNTFFELYEGTQQLDVPLHQALLFANRRRIPYRFAVRCPSLWVVERFVRWFGRSFWIEQLYPAHLFYFSFVGLWLCHRDLWHECGGYDERLVYMNEMESDMIARLLQKYEMVNLGKLVDYDFYHLEHYHPLATRCPSTFRTVNPNPDYARNPPSEFHPNGENWGLSEHPLQTVACHSDRGLLETVGPKQSLAEWVAFTLVLLPTGVQVAGDKVILSVLAGRKALCSFYSTWRHRAAVAWETVSRAPLTNWPGLLIMLWRERGRPHAPTEGPT